MTTSTRLSYKELRAQLVRIAYGSDLDLRDTFRYGFELETDSTNGTNFHEYEEENGTDYSRFHNEFEVWWATHLGECLARPVVQDYLRMRMRLSESGWKAVLGTIRDMSASDLYALCRQSQGSFAEELAQKLRAEGVTCPHYGDATYRQGNLPVDLSLIDVKYDGTVSGFEFTTNGPKDWSGVRRAAAHIFNKKLFNHEVGVGCSFHVHVSVPGVQHTYNPALQRHLVEYVLDNQHRLSEAVRKRFREAPENKHYIQPRLDGDKYRFVHYNSRCNSWEFRCFGNVDNLTDALQCIRLAREAVSYAYRMKLEKRTSPTQHAWYEGNDWYNLMIRSMNENVSPFTLLLPYVPEVAAVDTGGGSEDASVVAA